MAAGKLVKPIEVAPIPRLALDRSEAAAALGMSLDSFERYVQPCVRIIRLGGLCLVAVAEPEECAGRAINGLADLGLIHRNGDNRWQPSATLLSQEDAGA